MIIHINGIEREATEAETAEIEATRAESGTLSGTVTVYGYANS